MGDKIGRRVHRMLKPFLTKIEEIGEKIKPGVKESFESYNEKAVHGILFVNILSFCSKHTVFIKRAQPAFLGANVLLGLLGTDSVVLEYSLVVFGMVFQTKTVSAVTPA